MRDLSLWDVRSEKGVALRAACARHNDSAYYREAIKIRSDEAICNIAITLIHQADVMLRKYLEWVKADFLKNGGIREQMMMARLEYRSKR